MAKKSLPKTARDNRANQLNPIHPAYHQARGASPAQAKEAADAAVDATPPTADINASMEPANAPSDQAMGTSPGPNPNRKST